MKKTYETPVIALSGNSVRDTRTGDALGCEITDKLVKHDPCVGSVGYYL